MADGSIDLNSKPTKEIDVSKVFGFESSMKVTAFSERSERPFEHRLFR